MTAFGVGVRITRNILFGSATWLHYWVLSFATVWPPLVEMKLRLGWKTLKLRPGCRQLSRILAS